MKAMTKSLSLPLSNFEQLCEKATFAYIINAKLRGKKVVRAKADKIWSFVCVENFQNDCFHVLNLFLKNDVEIYRFLLRTQLHEAT